MRQPLQRDESSGRRDDRITRRRFLSGLAAAGIAATAAVAKAARDRFALRVFRYDVPLPRLPRSAAGLTIAQLSDLHLSPWIEPAYLEEAVAMTNALAPDVVVITGDFISVSPRFAWPCAEVVAKLEARRGVYGVLGNHDHWEDAQTVTEALTEQAGVVMLTNRYQPIAPGLWLAGIDDLWAGDAQLDQTLAGIPTNQALVLLSHNPRAFDLAARRPCLVLSGHTHGGQVAVPLVPRVLPPDMKGTPYVEGWYQKGAARMYVNRGVGMVFPPVRFRVRPEIALLTLRHAGHTTATDSPVLPPPRRGR